MAWRFELRVLAEVVFGCEKREYVDERAVEFDVRNAFISIKIINFRGIIRRNIFSSIN